MTSRNGGGAIRVMVAATSTGRRAELESIIRSQPDFDLAASTGNVARIAKLAEHFEADVVVAEVDVIPALTEPPAAIVLLTRLSGPRTIAKLLKAGVRSILPRGSEADEIVSAVYAAHSGHVLLSSEAAERLASAYSDSDPGEAEMPIDEITPREAEVLRMLAEGLVNKDIAARLGISDHTVKFHISSILDKLGASTRTEAVTLGIRRGWIPI
jgi:two-component system, NarL family, response regulator YdfI